MNAKIVILLATHNRAHLIRETLDSILRQTYTNWVCLIIDDRSTDSTMKAVEKYISDKPKFFYFRKPEENNPGLSASRNYGLRIAQELEPDFIQFFDDDDIMHPQKLELQVKSFLNKPAAQLSLCATQNFKNKSEILINEVKKFPEISDLSLGEAYLTSSIQFVAQVPLFRYEYAKNFQFDEDLFYAEEWVLFSMHFLITNPDYTIINNVLFYRRKHPVSITEEEDTDHRKRKTSAITGVKIFNFLDEHNAHTKMTLLFFTRQFLIYNYDSHLIMRIGKIIKHSFPEMSLQFRLAKLFHWFGRKLILKTLKYK